MSEQLHLGTLTGLFRAFIDQRGLVDGGLIDAVHPARHGRIHVRGALDALHDANGLLALQLTAYRWQLYVDQVTERLLCIMGDAQAEMATALTLQPFMLARIQTS